MKQWICIAWIILVGLQTGYQGLVYAYYALQKEQIIKKHCINKNRPALKCDGKCHLKTMLAANGEEPTSNSNDKSSRLKEIIPQPLLGLLQPLPQFSTALGLSILSLAPVSFHEFKAFYQRLRAEQLLDPPQCLA